MTTLDFVLSSSLARNNLFSLFDTLASKLRGVVEWMEGWVETWEIMQDRKLSSEILNSMKSKKTYTANEVAKILKW